MSATRAKDVKEKVTARPGAKAIDRPLRPLRLLLDIGDVEDVGHAALAATITAAGARLGLVVGIGEGGRPLRVSASGTIAHALRVEAIREIGDVIALAEGVSLRAQRAIAPFLGDKGARTAPTLLREETDGRLWMVTRAHTPVDLGEAPEAEAALREARARGAVRPQGAVAHVDLPPGAEERARAIAFGPSRTLSEPSSRRLLEAFGVTFPPWRLAEDAARAAAHARAVRYPIDLYVASPDVSAVETPALAAIELRTPGEVREAFRGVTREARRSKNGARMLGVVVARHVATMPLLRLRIEREGDGPAVLQIGLDDPIGSKLARPLVCPLPETADEAAAALDRFEGRGALPGEGTPRLQTLVDLVVRLARIVHLLPDTLVRLDASRVAPVVDDVGWLLGAARLRVRGVEVA